MPTTIDYTKARLGSGPRGHKIERCPKCGRKGRMTRMLNATSGGRPIPPRWRCDHVVRATSFGTFVLAHCGGRIVDGVDTVRPPAPPPVVLTNEEKAGIRQQNAAIGRALAKKKGA
jgi:hypothetical protein